MLVFLAQARSVAALSEVVAAAAVMVVVVCVVASGVVSVAAATAAGSRPLALHVISRIKTYMQTTPVLISLLLTVA
jgi:hypothetical protein